MKDIIKMSNFPKTTLILEKTEESFDYRTAIRQAKTYQDIENIFVRLFGITPPSQESAPYKKPDTDFAKQTEIKKTAADLKRACKQALDFVEKFGGIENIAESDQKAIREYAADKQPISPTIASGIWDALRANGFENGKVLDPCCGTGLFSATKPEGASITAVNSDTDPLNSKVASILNPADIITNQPFETLATSAADGTFDSALATLPLASARSKNATKDPVYKDEKNIGRYYILRVLDKIKPNGLACFICPPSIIGDKGKAWEEFRIAVSKKAEFLGAHKLPSGTLKKRDTVIDIAVFRKHKKELLDRIQAEEIPVETLQAANVIWDEFVSGKYWQGEGKPFIQGRFIPASTVGTLISKERVEGSIDESTIKIKLAQKFESRILWDVLDTAESIERPATDGDTRFINGKQEEFQGGTWTETTSETTSETEEKLSIEKYGASSKEELQSILANPEDALQLTFDQVKAIAADFPTLTIPAQVQTALKLAEQQSPQCQNQVFRGIILGEMLVKIDTDEKAGENVDARRESLQNAIISEIEKYGHPANNPDFATISGDGAEYFNAFKNAVSTTGEFSSLLSGKVQSQNGYNSSSVASIVSYLTWQKEDQHITLDTIRSLYTGSREIKSLGDIADIPDIAITPEGTIEPINIYCSGDVAEKTAAMQDAIAQATDDRIKNKLAQQIEYLHKRMHHTDLQDIQFSLRQRWFPAKYIIGFLNDNGYPDVKYCDKDDGEEGDEETSDGFYVGYGGGFNAQLANYINGDKITSNKKEIKEQYQRDITRLEEQFNAWIKSHIDAEDIEKLYNSKFNNYVQPEYSNSPLDCIQDIISGQIQPHTYQNQEVRRLADMGSGICGFGVGLGKFFTALALAAYNAKKGNANRTCIVVPASVLENWYHEARQFYSETYMRDFVHVVGLTPKKNADGSYVRKPVLDEKGQPKQNSDGTPVMQDVVEFAKSSSQFEKSLKQIPNSKFKLVVMTKERFQSIPMRKETSDAYFQTGNGKGLFPDKNQQAIEDKQAKKRLQNKIPYLEDMGFDSIITDECHFYKNSLPAGKNASGIKYLSTAPTSDLAVDVNYPSIKGRSLRKL